jgi:chloramphenicol-sensitive protein RarD
MSNEKSACVIYAVVAYTLWGILPIYWKLINSVSSIEILSNRIVWAFIFMVLVIVVTKQWEELKFIAKDKKQMFYIFIASILITINWGLFIWAVNSGKILDTCLGNYINPLLSVALGVVIFKEKLSYWQVIALTSASIGVIIITLQNGKLPWTSIGMAISFGLYGAIKKFIRGNSIVELTLETTMLTPVALAYIVLRQFSGLGVSERGGLVVIILLIGSGVVTAIPLLLFTSAAKRLPLSLIGFTQYISPTISLLIGIFVYHEGFTAVNMVGFSFIWVSLAICSLSQMGLTIRQKVIEQ